MAVKVDQLSVKIPTSPIARPSKIYHKCDFWSKNMYMYNQAILLRLVKWTIFLFPSLLALKLESKLHTTLIL
jgi:hypothetical protein